MWDELMASGNPLDDVGPLAHLRSTTVAMLEEQYGRWLAWLATIEPTSIETPPPDRFTSMRLRDWIQDMSGMAPTSRALIADGALRILRAAAPDHDWRVHLRLIALQQREGDATRGKRKQGRVLSSAVLLDAGLSLAGPHADEASTPLEAAKRRRDGAMLALLALIPIRLRALTALELGHSLLKSSDGMIIALSADMTKTGVSWETRVPDVVAAPLLRYLDAARPWLMARTGRDHARVWVNGQGDPLVEGYLSRRVSNATQAMTGVRVPPHFFRDAAATTLTRLSPESARLIRPLLAHSGYDTAARHYIHAEGIETARDYAGLLRKLRETGP